MPLCLSILERPDLDVVRNHAHYCRLQGYPHVWIEQSPELCHRSLMLSYKYGLILQHLRALPENDWLLFLDGDSVVFHSIPVESLLGHREMLVVDGPSLNSGATRVMVNMFVLRNTPCCRELLDNMLNSNGKAIAAEQPMEEDTVLRTEAMLPVKAVEAGHHVNLSWRFIGWFQAEVKSFVVHLGTLPSTGKSGGLIEEVFHDRRLQSLVAKRVNEALIHGEPVFPEKLTPPTQGPLTSYNTSAEIAFVTLYTHHISAYASIAEQNVLRYCNRHGYGYHVYRAIPEQLDPSMAGSWTKTWLLKQHLSGHKWVIWIDADMLFWNQARPLEPLLSGRDLMLARDIGAWPVNSGLMGFRNTPANHDLLEQLWNRISQVQDKSKVYSSEGDQHHTVEVLREQGLLGPETVTDFMTINTPYWLANAHTLLVHLMGLGEPYRSFYMAALDTMSQRDI